MRTALLFLACSLASSGMAAQLPIRPLPGGGPAAETLLAYTTEHAAYSLLNSLELLKLQVGRIDTRIQTVPFANLSSNALSKARYLIVLSPDSRIDLPTNVVDLVLQSNVPVFWIGQGLDALAGALKSQVYIGEQLHSATAVLSNGQERNVAPFLFREIGVVDNSATVRLNASGSSGSHAHPVCLTAGRFTLFTTEPQNGPLGYFLEDVLHDFFQVRETRTNNAFICIEGYQLHGNHREVRRMSDFLASRSIPFALAARDISPPLSSEAETVEFLSTLRYAQQRGGRVVLAGMGDALQSLLWDANLDRPRSDLTASELRAKVAAATQAALAAGLLPVAWQTPQFAADSSSYREISAVFGTAVERVQLSDATARDNYAPAGVTIDRSGRWIVPLNVAVNVDSTNNVTLLENAADILAHVRGGIIGVSFDSNLPLIRLVEVVNKLEQYRLPFLDLAELPNRVQLRDTLLLTGGASVSLGLQDTTIRWKTFDRRGQLLAEDEQKTRFTGQREFKRIGIGTFELVQFRQGGAR